MPKISDDRRLERRTRIIEAAWICFARRGLHQTTLLEIIRESGLSASAVHSDFASKDALIAAAISGSLGDLRDLVGPILAYDSPPPPAEFVRQLTSTIDGFAVRGEINLKRIALLGWSETQRNEPLLLLMQGFYRECRSRLEQVARAWQTAGLVGAGPPAEIAKTVLALLLGYMVESALLEDISPDDLATGIEMLR